LEFGEHPGGEGLKRPANAVLTGKRQCQPRGEQGAENERGGHGEDVSMGKEGRVSQFRHASSVISTATQLS